MNVRLGAFTVKVYDRDVSERGLLRIHPQIGLHLRSAVSTAG